jgi:TATA-box binding protein (TBP) (component of TFIID and TFIIIB)
VGGTFYDTELDLEKLLRAWKTLTVANFTGRVLRVGIQIGRKIVNATALCFGPGSVQIMGSRNSEHMRMLLHIINDRFLHHGYQSEIKYISLDNKVAAGAFGFYARLAELHMNIPKFLTFYCPRAFPGLVSVWNDPDATKCTMVVFENGKVQVLGIEDVAIANDRYRLLCIVAAQHKVDASVASQLNKSVQRDVCNRNCQQALAAVPAAIRGNAELRMMKASNHIYEYMRLNRHREQDTAYHQGLDEYMQDKLPGAKRGKKRAAAVADADGNANAELEPRKRLSAVDAAPASTPRPKRSHKRATTANAPEQDQNREPVGAAQKRSHKRTADATAEPRKRPAVDPAQPAPAPSKPKRSYKRRTVAQPAGQPQPQSQPSYI